MNTCAVCGLPIRRLKEGPWVHNSPKWDPFKDPHAPRPLPEEEQ